MDGVGSATDYTMTHPLIGAPIRRATIITVVVSMGCLRPLGGGSLPNDVRVVHKVDLSSKSKQELPTSWSVESRL
jgi:hypothetical protein